MEFLAAGDGWVMVAWAAVLDGTGFLRGAKGKPSVIG
jgi:hypothetical protein